MHFAKAVYFLCSSVPQSIDWSLAKYERSSSLYFSQLNVLKTMVETLEKIMYVSVRNMPIALSMTFALVSLDFVTHTMPRVQIKMNTESAIGARVVKTKFEYKLTRTMQSKLATLRKSKFEIDDTIRAKRSKEAGNRTRRTDSNWLII